MKKKINYEKLARSFSKKKILSLPKSKSSVNYGIDYIKKIIKHRPPFLLIDKIEQIYPDEKIIKGSYLIKKDDPILKGHFPDYPIFPGVMHIEMIGQLGLCLHRILSKEVANSDISEEVRLIKIHHAIFLEELSTNDKADIVYKEFESDEFTVKGVGQILKKGKICSTAIAEFYKVT